jgi:hypothetical protein
MNTYDKRWLLHSAFKLAAGAGLAAGAAVRTAAVTPVFAAAREFSPLNQYGHPGRQDNTLVATEAGRAAAAAAGYEFVRTEGWIDTYVPPGFERQGASSLDIYWHAGRADSFTTATDEGRRSAAAAGYVFARTEGWVTTGGGRHRLDLYWHAGRGDNFTTATDDGRRSAAAAGYALVRTEGWIPFSGRFDDDGALKVFWHAGAQDHLTATTGEAALDAARAGYQCVGREVSIARGQSPQPPGTVPLDLYWHAGRRDNLTTATDAGRRAAQAAGYGFVRREGWVYPSVSAMPSHLQQAVYTFDLYWHPGREDHLLTSSPDLASAARAAGYQFVRHEAYIGQVVPA